MFARWLWLVGVFVGVSAEPMLAQDRYYLLMFASQRIPRNPNYSHTFATFVRCSPDQVVREVRTISWLPAEFPIRVQALRPQAGRNYGLHETLRIALRDEARISLWGPYEIDPELYQRAETQIARLESGTVRYKANDGFFRNDVVSNCIHAVSELSQGPRLHVLSPGWGDTASHFVLESLMPWVKDRTVSHDWLVPALGLGESPIAYRKPADRPLLKPVTGLQLFLADGRSVPTYGPPRVRGRWNVLGR